MTKKKVNNEFKVNMTSEDVLIEGGTRRVFLKYHNDLRDMLMHIDEARDITLGHIKTIEDLVHELHSSMNFVPQKNQDDDTPNHYADFVLPSSPKAWHRAY